MESIQVLLVEDSKFDARLVKEYLVCQSAFASSYTIHHFPRLSEGLSCLAERKIDVILLDLTLPDSAGIETLRAIAGKAPHIPIIVLTGLGDDRVASEAVSKGAQDFIEKGTLNEKILQRSIQYAIERKRSEMDLRKATEELKKLDQMKSEFVSTVSHELRTPMTIVREGVSQMLDGLLGSITGEQRQFLTMTLEGIDRLSGIINDLLDMSKLEAGRVEISRHLVDLTAIANRVVSEFSKSEAVLKKKLNLKVTASEPCMHLYADSQKLTQVLVNLLGNAIKFTDSGSVTISIIARENQVECHVSDTGRGIGVEDLPKVFEKFHQFGRTPGPGIKGTGLGLSICKGIIELHHGKIWVESEPNKGSSFKFLIPRYSMEQLFQEIIKDHIGKSIKREEAVSFIGLHLSVSDEQSAAAKLAIHQLGELAQKTLRRSGDIVVGIGGIRVLAVLSATTKKDARIVETRIREALNQFLIKEKLHSEIKIELRLAGFPLDGSEADEIIKKII